MLFNADMKILRENIETLTLGLVFGDSVSLVDETSTTSISTDPQRQLPYLIQSHHLT